MKGSLEWKRWIPVEGQNGKALPVSTLPAIAPVAVHLLQAPGKAVMHQTRAIAG